MRPTDIITSIHWYDADTCRPPLSGTYLASFDYGSITSLKYSKKNDAFNCDDDDDDLRMKLSPTYWAFMPDNLTEILEEAWNERHEM